MANHLTLVRQNTPKPTTQAPQTLPAFATEAEAIRLHGMATNALSMALSLLNRPDATPQHLAQATARAVRAATLLKRASMAANVGGAA